MVVIRRESSPLRSDAPAEAAPHPVHHAMSSAGENRGTIRPRVGKAGCKRRTILSQKNRVALPPCLEAMPRRSASAAASCAHHLLVWVRTREEEQKAARLAIVSHAATKWLARADERAADESVAAELVSLEGTPVKADAVVAPSHWQALDRPTLHAAASPACSQPRWTRPPLRYSMGS